MIAYFILTIYPLMMSLMSRLDPDGSHSDENSTPNWRWFYLGSFLARFM